ncbi:unnamed protein product [Prunus brigantina]
MDPNASSPDISFEFPTLFRIYKDGCIERLKGTETVQPSTDLETGVRSKDIVLSPEPGLSAVIFLPKLSDLTRKLPLLLFIHGGAFVIESPYSPPYHNHAALLTSEANVVFCLCTIGEALSSHSLLHMKTHGKHSNGPQPM